MNTDSMQDENDYLDIGRIIGVVLSRKKLILIIVIVSMIIGLIVAFGSGEEYSTNVRLIPEAQRTPNFAGLSVLARQFGVSPGVQGNEGVPVELYPDIILSNTILLKLISSEVEVTGLNHKVTLSEYLSNYQKQPFTWTIRKYTIGLPNLLISKIRQLIRGNEVNLQKDTQNDQVSTSPIMLSGFELGQARYMRSRISVDRTPFGIINIRVTMSDRLVAAYVAHYVIELLSEFVVEKRTEKARQEVVFVEERLNEAKDRFQYSQINLAEFRDKNRGTLTATAQISEQVLQSEYSLTFNLYNALAEQYEQAQIKLKQETPVLSILEPPVVPNTRSYPIRGRIIIMSIIIGFVIGIATVIIVDLFNQYKRKNNYTS